MKIRNSSAMAEEHAAGVHRVERLEAHRALQRSTRRGNWPGFFVAENSTGALRSEAYFQRPVSTLRTRSTRAPRTK